MRKEDGFSIIPLILGVVVIAVVIFVAVRVLFGDNGYVNQIKDSNTEYNKNEVVEELNLKIKEKYFGDYKYAQENKKNIDEIYTVDNVLGYLIDKNYIEQLRDVSDNPVQDQYYIITTSLDRDIENFEVKANGSNGNGTKVFKLKKENDIFNIYFVNAAGEEELLGELDFKPEI